MKMRTAVMLATAATTAVVAAVLLLSRYGTVADSVTPARGGDKPVVHVTEQKPEAGRHHKSPKFTHSRSPVCQIEKTLCR